MVNFGPLTAEICWGVWGTPANFNGFRVLASLLHRRRSVKVNQTLHGVWLSLGLVHYIYIFGDLAPNGVLSGAKFTFRLSLAFSYTGSFTAQHSSGGRQPNFAAWGNEGNYGFMDLSLLVCATYIPQGGHHHVGHRSTF